MNERHFRLYERIVAIEDSLEALGPIDKLIERIEELEKMVKQTKTSWGLTKHVSILVFLKACYTNLQPQKKFHTISQGEKMLYFNREEIDKWLLQKQTRGHWNGKRK